MRIAVPRETWPGERRVPLVPESCKRLAGAGMEVLVESGAGAEAYFADSAYTEAGARLLEERETLLAAADLILKVQPPDPEETGLMKSGAMLITTLVPTRHLGVVRALLARGITSFATDLIPRITRAQAMDTLSSMANITGYKGVLIAASRLPKYFPMFMTAAGTVFPARVFVIGAGVAGLQAIATARRLGANVFATDVRPEVREQIESVGGKYVGVQLKEDAAAAGGYARQLSEEDRARQRELLEEQCAAADVVISTALVGGLFAPRLITGEMVSRMRPGSLIVDLAADGGGNCVLSRPGETVTEKGVQIIAPLNLPSTMPLHASTLYSRNLTAFVTTFSKHNAFQLDWDDPILRGAVVTHAGEVRHEATREALEKTGG